MFAQSGKPATDLVQAASELCAVFILHVGSKVGNGKDPPPHRDIFKSAVTGLDFTFMELFTKVFGLPDSKGDNRQGRVCSPARGKLASV